MLSEKRERLLEQELEKFMGTTTLPQIKVSEGTKRFAERIYAAAHEGKLPSEMIEEERQRAEEAARQLEAERQRAQEEANRHLEETIVRMSRQLAMPTAQIATALDVSVEVVEDILLHH